jgi:hypothetical protein
VRVIKEGSSLRFERMTNDKTSGWLHITVIFHFFFIWATAFGGWCTLIHSASKGVWSQISHFGLTMAPVHISPLFTSFVQDSNLSESPLLGASLC